MDLMNMGLEASINIMNAY